MGTKSTPLGSSSNGRVIKDDANDRIYSTDSNNVPVSLMGNQQKFGQGFYVAAPGVNAITNTDPLKWIFNSNQDVFKVAAKPTGTLSLAFNAQSSGASGTFSQNSTNTLVLPHNLGIIPSLVPQLFDQTSNTYVPVSNGSIIRTPALQVNGNGIVGFAIYTWQIWADTENVYIQGIREGGGGTSTGGYSFGSISFGNFTFKVFCLQETAN